MDVGVPELLIILAVVLLVFGSTRVPKLARALGEASREFRAARRPTTNPTTLRPRRRLDSTNWASICDVSVTDVAQISSSQGTSSGRNS